MPEGQESRLAGMLGRLSMATIMLHPREHLQYYLKSMMCGISFALFVEGAVMTPLLLLFFATYLLLAFLQTRLETQRTAISPLPAVSPDSRSGHP